MHKAVSLHSTEENQTMLHSDAKNTLSADDETTPLFKEKMKNLLTRSSSN